MRHDFATQGFPIAHGDHNPLCVNLEVALARRGSVVDRALRCTMATFSGEAAWQIGGK